MACKNKNQPGGCQLHNLMCSYPECDIAKYADTLCEKCSKPTNHMGSMCYSCVQKILPLPLLQKEDSPHPDDIAVDKFAKAMKEKLAKARERGRSGWEDMTSDELSDMLREHVAKGDPIDVANFCMFLWSLKSSIRVSVNPIFRPGSLLTLNQDEYPGLGKLWIQLRSKENPDVIVARVYGDSLEEIQQRIKMLNYSYAVSNQNLKETLDQCINAINLVRDSL